MSWVLWMFGVIGFVVVVVLLIGLLCLQRGSKRWDERSFCRRHGVYFAMGGPCPECEHEDWENENGGTTNERVRG